MITNNTGVSLALAVWMVHDEYDYSKIENYISATSLMKPLRHLVLPHRIPKEDMVPEDVVDFTARALGHSIHDSVEKAWVKGYKVNLAKLGYSQEIIDRVLINPSAPELKPDSIPVYIEQRAIREVEVNGRKWKVGGKFDMVTEGIVQDNKTTSAYTWVYGGRNDEHALQGSLYRWLNPDKITEGFIRINYLFTDWQKAQARSNPNYPQKRVEHKDIPLIDITETEDWVKAKLASIQQHWNTPEKQLPLCTPEELWMSDPKFKYYSDPAKIAGRSTKNFDNMAEARKHIAEKGGKGIIITEPGVPKRCDYCNAFAACTQKDLYFT